MNTEQPDVASLVRKELGTEHAADFRPCAFFDERLDCIRVITKDCSVLEQRLGDRLTILLNNYDPAPGRKECVGFTLKGARHLCNQHNLNTQAPIAMSRLLDGILASLPDQTVQVFIELVAKPLVEQKNIDKVEVPEPDAVLEPA